MLRAGASLHRTGLVLFRLLSVQGYRRGTKEEDQEEKRKTKNRKTAKDGEIPIDMLSGLTWCLLPRAQLSTVCHEPF